MKKSYRYKFNTATIVFMIISVLIALAGIIYSALRIAGVFEFVSLFPIIDISAIVVCALILTAVLVLTFDTKYILEEDGFSQKMFLFKKKIPTQTLNYIVKDENTKDIFLYFVTNPEQGTFEFLPIVIDKEKNKDFFKDFKKFYPTVIIDVFKKD